MRAESEMYDIIIRTAESDDRVLAAYLKGSRANPNAHKDICQDFDIMYVVKETESFRTDLSWMEPFGKVILKQEQDDAFGYGEVASNIDQRLVVDLRFFGYIKPIHENWVEYKNNMTDGFGMPQVSPHLEKSIREAL